MKWSKVIFPFPIIRWQLYTHSLKLLCLHLWTHFAPSSCAISSSQPWVFIFFASTLTRATLTVQDICMFLRLLLSNMIWCGSRRLKISELTVIWLLRQWCLWRVPCIYPAVFFIVRENVLGPCEFFRTQLWIDPGFGLSWDSWELLEIQTRALHRRWLRFQTLRLSFPFICNFIY